MCCICFFNVADLSIQISYVEYPKRLFDKPAIAFHDAGSWMSLYKKKGVNVWRLALFVL
jgi:hypothetical protein